MTGFEGFDEEIQRVRNANWGRPETLELALPELAGAEVRPLFSIQQWQQ